MSRLRPVAVKDASATHKKDIFELLLTRLEPLNGESRQAKGRPLGQSSHPLVDDLFSEDAGHLGTIQAAAHRPSRAPQIWTHRAKCTAVIPLGTRLAAMKAISKCEKRKISVPAKGSGIVLPPRPGPSGPTNPMCECT